ncbi:DUF6614 family protein [Vannielia litorea]|uniref:DUF6614 family protein n=1 Tax=Vannielia litorea TaxID=1217970 RepID=UPI001BD0021D|nr:hypothetical protein [Vannielia litorea]
MILYHCMIELKQGSRALAFATATEAWMGWLQGRGHIRAHRLMRRKMSLASGRHTDFMLEIEMESLDSLEETFAALSGKDEAAERLYAQMRQMIHEVDVGLYRPYPDPEQRETVALV